MQRAAELGSRISDLLHQRLHVERRRKSAPRLVEDLERLGLFLQGDLRLRKRIRATLQLELVVQLGHSPPFLGLAARS